MGEFVSETAIESKVVPTGPEILRAGAMLAGVCDGAVALDGAGYNAVDSPTAKSILAAAAPTDRQLRCLWHILRKYRKQLERMGVNYDTFVPPPLSERGSNGRFLPPSNRVKFQWVETAYGRRIAVVFAYDPKIVGAIKTLEKRWFDKEGKNSAGLKNAWLIPDDADHLDNALAALEGCEPSYNIEIEPTLKKEVDSVRERRASAYKASRAESAEIQVPTKMDLYPFQKAGVKWIDERDGKALISDEPGCGKSAQALGWLVLRREKALPALVVAPANLRVNWMREAAKFTDLKCMVIAAKSAVKALQKLGIPAFERPMPGYDVAIVNYDVFRCRYDKAAKKVVDARINGLSITEWTGFKTLVLDECHRIKEREAQVTRTALALAEQVTYRIGLTGTPVMNRPRDLWPQAKVVNPEVFPYFWPFAQRYCAAVHGSHGWVTTGASNLDELDRKLRTTIMIRRMKSQVLKELPPKIRCTIPIILGDNMKEYDRVAKPTCKRLLEIKAQRDAFKEKLRAMGEEARKKYLAEHAAEAAEMRKLTGFMIDKIEEVKQAAVRAKFDECVKFILDQQEQQGKVLVFMSHYEFIDGMAAALAKEGVKVDRIDGRVDPGKRDPIKDRFQEGDLEVLVCGIRAASEGLTLTASHTVVFCEFDWNPARHVQAEDRTHRISQTIAPTMYYLVGLNTIEEKIVAMIDAKAEVVNSALGEGDRMLTEDGILDALVEDLAFKGSVND